MNLKTAIRNRLPGGSKYYALTKFRKIKSVPADPFEAAIVKAHNKKVAGMRHNFFFGKKKFSSFFFNGYNEELYITMCKIFANSEEGESGILYVNGIKMQKLTSYEERCLFIGEAIDILFNDLIDNSLHGAITYEGPYELNNVRIVPGDIIIDAGANMGLFSALAANKGATVYAFEPNENIIDSYLSKTVKLNENITICKYALSDKSEDVEFIVDNKNTGASHLSYITKTSKQAYMQKSYVKAISLDEFVLQNKLHRIDFIKADIEGAERYMLMGAKQVLKEFAPKLAICTYHLPDDRKVLREIILEANSNYVIEQKCRKLYAYVPNR